MMEPHTRTASTSSSDDQPSVLSKRVSSRKRRKRTQASRSDDQPRGSSGHSKHKERKEDSSSSDSGDESSVSSEAEYPLTPTISHTLTLGDDSSEDSGSHTDSYRHDSSSPLSFMEDIEIDMVLNPEVLQGEDEHKNTYRLVCPCEGQFRCSLTGLVFVVEDEAELLYKMLSWDPRRLDGLGQMQPAGPLFNIDCFKGSISRLHLAHCEISEEDDYVLSVAHYTGGNVEIMKPLKVTKTHVMIEIKDLSIFGLIKRMLFPPSPVISQVLLFLRPKTVKRRENILDVHLLPWNVPVSEVKEQHGENTHIKTSSKCSLFPGCEYSVFCQPEASTVQPETEMFECNFGPNYHPTFEVFVDINTEEVRLGLLDKTEGKEVWLPRRIPLTGPDADSLAQRRLTESVFVRKHRDKLIERVSSVKAVADSLLTKDMITAEKNNEVQTAEPRQEKTRLLLDALDSGGAPVKAEFYRLLKEKEPYLVDELEAGVQGS